MVLWHGYTKKFFIFRYLLHFTTKCIGGQIIKLLVFSCLAQKMMQKVQKVWALIYRLIVKRCIKRKQTPVCLHAVKNYDKVESIDK